MPDRNKTAKPETLIMSLLAKEPEVSIRSIAGVGGVSADDDTERKAIQRALISLEKKDLIAPKGSGRSRVYVRSEHALDIPNNEPAPETSPAHAGDASIKWIELPGELLVNEIRDLVKAHNIPEAEREDVFNLVENEFISLHDGNAARFKVRPSEFEAWKLLQ